MQADRCSMLLHGQTAAGRTAEDFVLMMHVLRHCYCCSEHKACAPEKPSTCHQRPQRCRRPTVLGFQIVRAARFMRSPLERQGHLKRAQCKHSPAQPSSQRDDCTALDHCSSASACKHYTVGGCRVLSMLPFCCRHSRA